MAEESKDLRRGSEKAEAAAAIAEAPSECKDHKFTAIVDNPTDPPARKLCSSCGGWKRMSDKEVDEHRAELARVSASEKPKVESKPTAPQPAPTGIREIV